MSPPTPGRGASDGNLRSLARAACNRTCLGHGLSRTRGRSRGRHACSVRVAGSDRRIRRTVRACCFNSVLWVLAGKMARRRAQARRRKSATGALRWRSRPLRVSGCPAISRHRGQREGPRGTCPARRDQSRDQSCDQADERSGAVWRARRLELSSRSPEAPEIAKTMRSPSSSHCARQASHQTICGS